MNAWLMDWRIRELLGFCAKIVSASLARMPGGMPVMYTPLGL